jgi:lysophospholipase L1-like esterase
MLIQPGQTVLFQGDSITDCGRDYANPNSLGVGYGAFIGAFFSAAYPDLGVRFLNRGISGNRVKDLVARWTPDCIDLKPDWVSIMIGINDCWRRYDANDPTALAAFEQDCRLILNRTVKEISAKLILLEPFVLPYPPDRVAWREDLDPKIDAVRRLAREFKAVYVPLDGLFAAASARVEPSFWAEDGVHPTAAGHALIAKEWLKAVGAGG